MLEYIHTFKTALFLFPWIAALFTGPYILYNYHKYGSILSLRIAIVYSFILYLMTVYFLVILPLPSIESVAASPGVKPNFVPFRCIADIVDYHEKYHVSLLKNQALIQVLFNVLMLMPFGVYLRYYFQCSLKKTIVYSFLFSLFLELSQLSGLYGIYPKPFRMFDVDDLMANTIGGMFGYVSFGLVQRFLPSRTKMDEASYDLGTKVSLVRRIVSFGIDLIVAKIVQIILQLGFPISYWVCLLSYMILCSWLFHGQTVGKKITRLRLVLFDGQQPSLADLLVRYMLEFGSLFFLPKAISQLFWDLWSNSQIIEHLLVLIHVVLLFGWGALLLSIAIDYGTHRPAFYGRLSKTKVISTIRKKTL